MTKTVVFGYFVSPVSIPCDLGCNLLATVGERLAFVGPPEMAVANADTPNVDSDVWRRHRKKYDRLTSLPHGTTFIPWRSVCYDLMLEPKMTKDKMSKILLEMSNSFGPSALRKA
jgi:hypothetical protein